MEKAEYYQQLHAINQLLEECPDGPEKTELLGLKQNIEELISLTNEEECSTSVQNETPRTEEHNGQKNNSELDDEYAMFMAEMAKEGALETANTQPSNSSNCSQTIQEPVLKSSGSFKALEGKKFRAPHTHQWGQLAYHNAMVCFVPDEIPTDNEFEVKVLFLNPTHIEMQPCPYYFHSEKDCNFTEEQCRFSHGEAVSFSSLKEYIEPKFEQLTIGSSVLAKQSNDLWYRAKITSIIKEKEKCLVKFDSKNVDNQSFEEIDFAHILPLKADSGSDDDSGSDSNFEEAEVDFDAQIENDCLEAKRLREELINMSLMRVPEQQPLGDWEKHTKGIGSKLMQKMGYIVGTGLGKEGEGIVKPVTAMILPQGKSLDFCMNLKEKLNNPNLFDAEHRAKPGKKKLRRLKHSERQNKRKVVSKVQMEKMDIDEFIKFRFSLNKASRPLTKEKEYEILKEKLKSGSEKDLNVANFIIERNLAQYKQNIEELKLSIKRLEEVHADSQNVWKRLHHRELDVKSLNTYKMLITNEIDRRKDNKKMAVF